MTTATRIKPTKAIAAHETFAVSDRVVGLALASLIPAAFWMATLAIVGSLTGVSWSLAGLLLTGTAIAAFLAIVVSGMMTED